MKKAFETFDNVCNICGIEAYYPEIYTKLCPKCKRVIHTNHLTECECDKSYYSTNSKIHTSCEVKNDNKTDL
jgi:hypothetical protein